jgi:hypothetical protein
MATAAEVAAGARGMLRDFPKFFEISEGPLDVLTIRLPHPLISATSLTVYGVTTTTADPPVTTSAVTKDWTLDDRNGLLKLNSESFLGQTIIVSGYHYVWFTDGDLALAMGQAAAEQTYNRDMTVADMDPVESEVLMIGTVVRALWSLSIELALDIDVSTPEGMFIPAHQRYSQVIQQMQFWEGQYAERMASLNIGMGALEQFRLRRVSQTTGRYVPVYVDREFDDPRWPHRLYPTISEEPDNATPRWAYRTIVAGTPVVEYGVDYPAASFPEALGRGG